MKAPKRDSIFGTRHLWRGFLLWFGHVWCRLLRYFMPSTMNWAQLLNSHLLGGRGLLQEFLSFVCSNPWSQLQGGSQHGTSWNPRMQNETDPEPRKTSMQRLDAKKAKNHKRTERNETKKILKNKTGQKTIEYIRLLKNKNNLRIRMLKLMPWRTPWLSQHQAQKCCCAHYKDPLRETLGSRVGGSASEKDIVCWGQGFADDLKIDDDRW